MVGAAGFEPATLCSQSRCATRLRYAPDARPTGGLGVTRLPARHQAGRRKQPEIRREHKLATSAAAASPVVKGAPATILRPRRRFRRHSCPCPERRSAVTNPMSKSARRRPQPKKKPARRPRPLPRPPRRRASRRPGCGRRWPLVVVATIAGTVLLWPRPPGADLSPTRGGGPRLLAQVKSLYNDISVYQQADGPDADDLRRQAAPLCRVDGQSEGRARPAGLPTPSR